MKTPFLIGVFCFCLSGLQAQTNITPYTVVARDANSRVWERTTYETAPDGTSVPHKHSYTELGTGLHYRKGNQWVESKEEIKILPQGGAAATQGQHQVYFPSDIYDGIIEVVTPDGKHLKSRPLGLSYYDGRNNVLIAELKHSVGQILPSGNQVIYTNCFTDFAADLVCTYRKGGFESDVVFREQPPKPETFGLSSESSQLEMLTEFFDTLEPEQIQSKAHSLKSKVVSGGAPEMDDTTLKFGAMTMIQGKAFGIGQQQNNSASTRVFKTWNHLEGRTFLIEEVPVSAIQQQFQLLPAPSTAALSGRSDTNRLSITRVLPPSRVVQNTTNAIQIANAELKRNSGVVLDYIMVDSLQNYVFQNNSTYWVNSTCDLSGNTTFESGAVIKYEDDTVQLNVLGSVTCNTDPLHPAIFTSTSDRTVGEDVATCMDVYNLYIEAGENDMTYVWVYDDEGNYLMNGEQDPPISAYALQGFTFSIPGGRHYNFFAYDHEGNHFVTDFWATLEIGNITLGAGYGSAPAYYYEWGSSLCRQPPISATGLSLDYGGDLHDLRFRNLSLGISSSSNLSVKNIQFANCGTAVQMSGAAFYAGNILLTNVDTAFVGAGTAEHITFDRGSHLGAGSAAIRLANSILTGVTDYGTPNITLDHIQKLVSSSGVYKAAGGASYYLATSSSYRNVGTTDIDPDLLSELQTMTTYALEDGGYPDTDTPDLGYHYSLVDSDQDGLPDWWELKWFGNLSQNGTGDYDGDGLSNALEMLAGRNPVKAGAVPDTNNIVSFDVYTPLN